MMALELTTLPGLPPYGASAKKRYCMRACLLAVEIIVALACGTALGQDTPPVPKTVPIQLVRVIVDKDDLDKFGIPTWYAPNGYHIMNFRFRVLSKHGKVSYSGENEGNRLEVHWSVAPQKELLLGFEVNSEAGVLELDADVDIAPDMQANTSTSEKAITFETGATDQNSSGSYTVTEIIVAVIGVIVAILAWQLPKKTS
jgi:hypothetical protein